MPYPNVYTGIWINHSAGETYGLTLTLTDFYGTLFIAFLALFINFSGGQIWVLITYVLFNVRSKGSEQDGLHHQLQVTLRNSVSSLTDSWKFILLAWHWKGKTDRVFRRVLPLLTLSVLHCLKVGLASIYATTLVQVDPVILRHGSKCGSWNATALNSDYGVVYKVTGEQIQMWEKSAELARACYSDDKEVKIRSTSCWQRHGLGRLWRGVTNETCPFAERMCKDGHVYSLDTGLLDSTSDLGINARSRDRIQFRRKMTCAPLAKDGFVKGPVTGGLLPETGQPSFWTNVSLWNFEYGKPTLSTIDNKTNATFTYDDGLLRPSYNREVSNVFQVYISTYFPNETKPNWKWGYWDRSLDYTTFDAIPELQAKGVTSIIFLVTATCYPSPVDDPWFSSHTKINQGPGGSALYCLDGDARASPLACLEQHEFCNPDSKKCSGLTDTHAQPDLKALAFNSRQSAIAQHLFNVTSKIGLRVPIKILGGERTLLARSSALNAPPSNQWQLELDNWFGIMIAQTQSELLRWATEPIHPSNRAYIVPPADTNVSWMCNNQVIFDPRYMCFSVIGIILDLVLGGLLVLTSWFVDDIARAVQRLRGRGVHRRFEWRWNDMLQLQKTAFQAYGLGVWKEDEVAVPVTKEKETWKIPQFK